MILNKNNLNSNSKLKYKESDLQKSCVKYFRYRYPDLLIFSIPNGGYRNKRNARNLKLEGLVSGVPDLFIPSHKLFIELKVGKNKLSEKQKMIIEQLRSFNYHIEVCYNIDEFIEVLNRYMNV